MRGSNSESLLRSTVRTKKSHRRDKGLVALANVPNRWTTPPECGIDDRMVVSHTRTEPAPIEAQQRGPTNPPLRLLAPVVEEAIQDPPERQARLQRQLTR